MWQSLGQAEPTGRGSDCTERHLPKWLFLALSRSVQTDSLHNLKFLCRVVDGIKARQREGDSPVHVDFCVATRPTISKSSPTLRTPCSTLPVTTVPLPEIEKVSSTGMRKGFSVSLLGVGIFFSTASISAKMASLPSFASPPVAAASAEPLTMAMSSPGNS